MYELGVSFYENPFWGNLLPDYFKKSLKFGVEQESRVLPEITKKRADWTIRYIKNGDPKKVALMEDKRKGKEFSDAGLAEGLDQLTKYLKLVRTEKEQDPNQPLYGAVNIGTYTRFYQLDPYNQECINYPGTNGTIFELQNNEKEIHDILNELVAKTVH